MGSLKHFKHEGKPGQHLAEAHSEIDQNALTSLTTHYCAACILSINVHQAASHEGCITSNCKFTLNSWRHVRASLPLALLDQAVPLLLHI